MTLRHTSRPSIEKIVGDGVILSEQTQQLREHKHCVRVVIFYFEFRATRPSTLYFIRDLNNFIILPSKIIILTIKYVHS